MLRQRRCHMAESGSRDHLAMSGSDGRASPASGPPTLIDKYLLSPRYRVISAFPHKGTASMRSFDGNITSSSRRRRCGTSVGMACCSGLFLRRICPQQCHTALLTDWTPHAAVRRGWSLHRLRQWARDLGLALWPRVVVVYLVAGRDTDNAECLDPACVFQESIAGTLYSACWPP